MAPRGSEPVARTSQNTASASCYFLPLKSKTVPSTRLYLPVPCLSEDKGAAMAIRSKKKKRLSDVVETTRAHSEKSSPDKFSVMSWWKRGWFFCLILAVVTMLAYHPAWHGGILWDDAANITRPELRSLDGLRRIWFEPRATQQYYPLLHSSFWLQQKFWGDSHYHLVNLLLHIGCVVLVLKILRLLRIPGAELATILFALHPVNVETVAWLI